MDAHKETKFFFPFQILIFSLKIYLLLGWLMLSIIYAQTQNSAVFREKLIPT